MNEEEIYYSLALRLMPHITSIPAKLLVDEMGSAKAVFEFKDELLERIPELSPKVPSYLDLSKVSTRVEQELKFIEKKQIKCLCFNDDNYPLRLRQCEDAPILLFFSGNADLNALKVINMVGTRKATPYGTEICASFLRDLKKLVPDLLVVSGLAYGIDIHSHRNALINDFPTVGVLAHGLDRIYPAMHRKTAIRMLERGGVLTEFPSGTNPDRYNFVSRNRIVAGMSDATIVVESAVKGGALITADIAQSYNRDCFAFPGSIYSDYSKGCNNLIRDNKAALITSAEDLVHAMQWNDLSDKSESKPIQRDLFVDLNEDESLVVNQLKEVGNLQINTLVVKTGIPIQKMNSVLFSLEMKGVIRALAGGVYQVLS